MLPLVKSMETGHSSPEESGVWASDRDTGCPTRGYPGVREAAEIETKQNAIVRE